MQDRAVVDRQRVGHFFPPGFGLFAWLGVASVFKEPESVRIEEVPTIGWQFQTLVWHAAEHGPKGTEQAAPSIVAALQNLLALLIYRLSDASRTVETP